MPYHAHCPLSMHRFQCITKVKQRGAWLVSGWETIWANNPNTHAGTGRYAHLYYTAMYLYSSQDWGCVYEQGWDELGRREIAVPAAIFKIHFIFIFVCFVICLFLIANINEKYNINVQTKDKK
jgi:hypothetical protein